MLTFINKHKGERGVILLRLIQLYLTYHPVLTQTYKKNGQQQEIWAVKGKCAKREYRGYKSELLFKSQILTQGSLSGYRLGWRYEPHRYMEFTVFFEFDPYLSWLSKYSDDFSKLHVDYTNNIQVVNLVFCCLPQNIF